MDPLGAAAAILQISRNAYAVWQYIDKVLQGAKVIDATVSNLASEVNNLADSCDLVQNELRSVLTRSGTGTAESRYDKDGRLRRCINQQVTSCENTLEDLWELVETLWPRKRTFIEHASRQIDLQGKEKQIDELRKRIKAHSNALQTTLLVVSIQVANIAPDQITEQLSARLNSLQRSLTTIESKLDGTRRRKDSMGDEEATLVDFARETLRSGKTLYDASVAGGSIYGNDSVMGGKNAADANSGVAAWLVSVESLRTREGQPFAPSAPSLSPANEHRTVASDADDGAKPLMDEDDGYDSDDEHLIEIKLAHAAWNSGLQAFDAADWTKASVFLHNALERLGQLPRRQWKVEWDVFELQYRLAVCSYHTGSTKDAEAGLDSLSQHELSSNDQRVHLCNARHLLARIYVEQNRLSNASQECRSTMKARSRLLGSDHEQVFESIALMSRILRLRGQAVNADLHAELIPETLRDNLLAAVSALQPLHGSPAYGTQAALPVATVANGISANPASHTDTKGLMVPPSHSNDHGELPPSPSSDRSPLTLSPKLSGKEKFAPRETTSRPNLDHKSGSVDSNGIPRRTSSFATTSSQNSDVPWVKSEPTITAGSSPGGLPKRYSVPTIPGSPNRSYTRTFSTSTRAGSIISIEESTEETYLPLRESAFPQSSSLSPDPLSRAERKTIVARFKIESMHNLDEAICEGRLDQAQVLINAVFSGSTQLGNAANSIVFKANDLRATNKSPALHLAVLFGDLDLVKPLIKNGFSPNFSYRVSDEPGMRGLLTPLDLAFASRHEPIIRELLANGALFDPPKGTSPCRQLMAPASLQLWPPADISEITSILELMLSRGWPVARGFSRQDNPSSTPTLLHQTCALPAYLSEYRLPLVKLILDRFDINSLSVQATETPLHHAIRQDDHDVVAVLLQAQRSFRLRNMLQKQNKQGFQPLYLAVHRATTNPDLPLDIVKSLLDQGASLEESHTHYEARKLLPSKKSYSTAESIAMESGREDLIALVQLHREKRPEISQPLVRSRTTPNDESVGRAALPQMFVLR